MSLLLVIIKWFQLILNLPCILDNYWSIKKSFLLLKIEQESKSFVSVLDSIESSLLLVYILNISYWLLLYICVLTNRNKIYINIKLH